VEADKDFDESTALLRDDKLISPSLCAELQRGEGPPVCEQQVQQPPGKQADSTNIHVNPAGAKTKPTTSKKQQKLQYQWVPLVDFDGETEFGAADQNQAKKTFLDHLESRGFNVSGTRSDRK
jgi:hypothetical protein